MATIDDVYNELRGNGPYSKLDTLLGVGGLGGGKLDELSGKLDRIETLLGAVGPAGKGLKLTGTLDAKLTPGP